MGHFLRGYRGKGEAAVKTFLCGSVLILGMVSIGMAILFMVGLWRYSQSLEKSNTVAFPVSKGTVTDHLAVPASDDRHGPQTGKTMIKAETDPGNPSYEDQKEILTETLNEKPMAHIIAEIHHCDSSQKVQLIHALWLMAADRGVPDDALETMTYLAQYDADPVVTEKAAQAAKDLRRLKRMAEGQASMIESGPSAGQSAIQDHHDRGGAQVAPNDQAASDLDDLKTEGDPDSIQGPREGVFDREAGLAELVTMLEESDPTGKTQLIHRIWLLAADMGAPDSVLETLENVAAIDPDDSVAQAAMQAIEDLSNLNSGHADVFSSSHSGIAEEGHLKQDQIMDPKTISAMTAQGETVPVNIVLKDAESDQREQSHDVQYDALTEQALWDPYEDNRYRAIQGLSSIRSEAAVDILLQAALDPAASNRLKAIESLWLSAADGMDAYGDIRANLQQAVDDPDARVSSIAEKALTDLERLMASR